MTGRRWYVWRGSWPGLVEPWVVKDPVCPGRACACSAFRTWREAFDYADRMARAER